MECFSVDFTAALGDKGFYVLHKHSIPLTSVVIIQLSEDRKWVIWLGWKQNPQKLPSPTKFFLFLKEKDWCVVISIQKP